MAAWCTCGGDLRAEDGFDYFRNSWNVIGLKDYPGGTRVTPDNTLLLSGGATLEIRFGAAQTPLGRKPVKTLLDGWMPIVLLAAKDGAVRYDFQLWATPLRTAKDWQKAFDWPTEGDNFVNWIQVTARTPARRPAEASVAFHLQGKTNVRTAKLARQLAPERKVGFVCQCPLRRRRARRLQPLEATADTEEAELWRTRTEDSGRRCWIVAAGSRCPAARRPRPCWPPTSAS